jgi:hypothetical protein
LAASVKSTISTGLAGFEQAVQANPQNAKKSAMENKLRDMDWTFPSRWENGGLEEAEYRYCRVRNALRQAGLWHKIYRQLRAWRGDTHSFQRSAWERNVTTLRVEGIANLSSG